MEKKLLIIPMILVVFLALLFLIFFQPANQVVKTEILSQNLNTPWAIDFLPDDRLIFTQRGGAVSILENGQTKSIGNISVSQSGESGLQGVAVDPEFSTNKFVYLYYTTPTGNRLSRFMFNVALENETVLLDNIPGGSNHNGGRIKFGPDGKLYITTGEAGTPSLAQNIDSTGGKILRINKDGTVPSDNPFGNFVYSYGHRDPQGITWNPTTKEMYSSEHGNIRFDEINIISRGGNYGWPQYQGNDSTQGYQKPLIFYTDFTLAPSGIAYYKDALYVAGLRGNQLRKITLSQDGNAIINEESLFNNLGRIREVVEHNGYLYISTSNRDGRGVPQSGDDKIIRMKL